MSTLKHVLQTIGFDDLQQTAIVQAMAYTGCFAPSNEAEKENRQFNTLLKFQDMIPSDWYQSRQLLKNSQFIQDILNYEFQITNKDLFSYLIATTQIRILGNMSFAKQEYNRSETLIYSTASNWEMDLIQGLNVNSEANWDPAKGSISQALVHGMTEKGVRARIEHLLKNLAKHGDKSVNVYYLSNPRGLFNFEESTCGILASWFNKDLKLTNMADFKKLSTAISKVLKSSQNNWLNNLSVLKNEVLDSIKKTFDLESLAWPHKPEGTFAEIYNEISTIDKKESLESAWPTATHMVKNIILEIAPKFDASLINRIRLIPLYCKGQVNEKGVYQIANTTSSLKTFRDLYASTLNNDFLAVVTDNSVSHAAYKQMYLTNHILKGIPIIGIFDKASSESINIKAALEQLAKTIYATKAAKPFADKQVSNQFSVRFQ